MTHAQTGQAVTPLASRRTGGMRHLTRCGPVKTCPACWTALDGGPVLFHCPSCEKAVYAADVSNEFPVPSSGRAAA
jgi:hypothetical protein